MLYIRDCLLMAVDILFTNFIWYFPPFFFLFIFIFLVIYFSLLTLLFSTRLCDIRRCNAYCSADAREVALSQAGVWFDEDILKKRANFRGRVNEPSILAIGNISLTDQSVYRCRVDFREAKSRNSRINLTVIGKHSNFVHLFIILFIFFFWIFIGGWSWYY